MKTRHISVFFISLFCLFLTGLNAQEGTGIDAGEKPVEQLADSTAKRMKTEQYGLRIGVDLSKGLRTLLDDSYSGFEIVGDYRIKKRYYLAAELGNESREFDETNFNVTSRGSYLKAGFNYNAYNNWYGMSNLIYAGVRGGFSTFNQELNNYTIYNTGSFFEPDFREDNREFTGLNATWLEVQLGVQAEVLKNLYLGINLQLKRLITQKEPDGFSNLYIPGFNKVTTDNPFGVGYGYTLSYFIPIYKK